MSGLVKAVKKVFKKVTKFVKKYWKRIVIAVAVYFTAGVALAAMPSTAAFSSALPGFGVGGMFSNAAVAMGFTGAAGSGIAGTVAANAAVAAGAGAAAGAGTASAAAGGSGAGLGAAGGATSATTGLGAAGGMPGAVVGGASTGYTGAMAASATGLGGSAGAAGGAAAGAGTVVATKGVMSGLEKVALASTVFKGAGALMSPSEKKLHAMQWQQSFGVDRKGKGEGFGGIVKDAWGDRFSQSGSPFGGSSGEASEGEGGSAAAPAPAGQGAYGSDAESPFGPGADITAKSEAEAAQDQQFISGGYRNKSYSPV